MKKIISILLMAVMLISMLSISSFAASKGSITVQNVSGEAGEIVEVKIDISDNPGIIAMLLKVSYDTKKLSLVKATNGNVFADSTFMAGNDLSVSPYRLLWEDSLAKKNNSKNGTLVILKFKILEDTVGKTTVKVSIDEGSTFDINMKDVEFNTVNGKISVPFTVWKWILYYIFFGWIWM